METRSYFLVLAFPSFMLAAAIAPAQGKTGDAAAARLAATATDADAAAAGIHRGLQWLLAHQDEDGHWDPATFMRHDDPAHGPPTDGIGTDLSPVATTTLVILATRASFDFGLDVLIEEHSTLRQGYERALARGVRWLLRQQDERGGFRGTLPRNATTEHALATYLLTLIAAWGHGKDCPERKAADAAVDRLLAMRNAYELWGRGDLHRDTDFLSTYWAGLGLINAERWRPDVAEPLDRLWQHWPLRDHASLPTRHDEADRFRLDRLWASRSTRLAAGLIASRLLSERPEDGGRSRDDERVRLCALAAPTSHADADPLHCWLHSLALRDVDRKVWAAWSAAVTPMLLAAQRQDGNFTGSWDPVGDQAGAGGRVYATALAVLTLRHCHPRVSGVLREHGIPDRFSGSPDVRRR